MTELIHFITSKIRERDPAVLIALAAIGIGSALLCTFAPSFLAAAGSFFWALLHVASAGLTLVLMAGGVYITFKYIKNKGLVYRTSDKPPRKTKNNDYIDIGSIDIPGQNFSSVIRESTNIPSPTRRDADGV